MGTSQSGPTDESFAGSTSYRVIGKNNFYFRIQNFKPNEPSLHTWNSISIPRIPGILLSCDKQKAKFEVQEPARQLSFWSETLGVKLSK